MREKDDYGSGKAARDPNDVELTYDIDPEACVNTSPVPAIRTSIARRRLLTKLILGAAVVWLAIYLLHIAGLDTERARDRLGISKGMGRTTSGGTNRRPHGSVNGTGTWLGSLIYSGPDPDELVHGLPAAVDNPKNLKASSSLGLEAEYAYQWGPTTLAEYKHHLDKFLENHFPTASQARLKSDLELYLDSWTFTKDPEPLPVLGGTGISRKIYMTDKDSSRMDSDDVRDWVENKDGWGVIFLDDQAGEGFVDRNLGASRLRQVWDALPHGILHSDMIRYTLLYLNGGIYTDLDTQPLKPLSEWGHDPDLFRQGRGWLFPEDREDEPTPSELEEMKRSLGIASVVVGVESDVGGREDWHDWWPRPLQIVQWTIGSAPRHPIFLDVLLGITRATSRAYTWARDQDHQADPDSQPDITSEPKDGGPVGVMEWTGPGVWTDAVLRYLRVKYGVKWKDLTRLAKPMRIGEVVVLPVTGFSPGVGNFGAMSRTHPEAMVEHKFAGSWKPHKSEHEDE